MHWLGEDQALKFVTGGGGLDIKMPSYQYGDPYDPHYLYHGNPHTRKMALLLKQDSGHNEWTDTGYQSSCPNMTATGLDFQISMSNYIPHISAM